MILTDEHYVPSFRWRMAEYQALLRLDSSIMDQVVPLIWLPDIEYDFESKQPKKTMHEYILPFPKRFRVKWGNRPAWVTLSKKIATDRMDDGTHGFDYIFDTLRPHNAHVIPAIQLAADADTIAAVSRAITQDQHGLGIILHLEDLMSSNTKGKVAALAASAGVMPNKTDLIVDLRAPNFTPYRTFARALIAAMQGLGDLNPLRNLVLISTAIPLTFSDVAKGTDHIPRHDWLFYKTLCASLPPGMRRPIYGDYTIVHPDFTARDMRMVKASGKVIYTTAETWGTRKGRAFRGNEVQMHMHCQEIVGNAAFAYQGPTYSDGDCFIHKCAIQEEGPSNLTKWKEVGINHHITMVANELAKLVAAS